MKSRIESSRRELLAAVPVSLTGAAALGRTVFAQTAEPEYVEVKTSHGRRRGAKTGNLTTFKGIPYAGSVSGANRFKAAPPLTEIRHERGQKLANPLRISSGYGRVCTTFAIELEVFG